MKTLTLALFFGTAIHLTAFAAVPLEVTMSSNRITTDADVVHFDLANPGKEAAITHVFNLQSEEVAQLSAESLGRFFWDGKDVDQQPVESGLYVVQIRHGGEVWHGPVLVNR